MNIAKNTLSIAFVTNNYKPYSGGVVSSIEATAQQLRQLGHQVYIITLDFVKNDSVSEPFVFRVTCPIKFKYKKNYMALPWRAYAQVTQYIGTIKPDVIHTHHPFLLGNIALKIARAYAIPLVFTYHTMYEQYVHYVPLPQILMRYVVLKYVTYYCNAVDTVVVPSRSIYADLVGRGVTMHMSVMPSPIQSIFLPTNFIYKKPSSCIQLLTVGRFVKEKNISFILDVVAQLPRGTFQLILAGYGSEHETLQQYAYETLGLSRDVVLFVHKPEKTELKKLYQDADIFLFSSTTDTQALVLAEAMAGGTPVIALDGPGQRDIVENGSNGFIVADRDAMVAKIRLIARDEGFHQKLSKNAMRTAQRYSAHTVVEQLLDVYIWLAEKR